MVPDHTTVTFDNILVPVDFSDSSAEALRCAISLAERARGDWKAVAVECSDDVWLDWGEDHGRMREQLGEFLETATGRSAAGRCIVEPLNRSVLAVDHTGISPAHHIGGADIASTIAQVAKREKASLLVVGTRGRSRSALLLLGSVTEHLMQLATCPVLAVKHAGHLGLAGALLDRLRKPELNLIAS
jgi:nucleotide-binding universal stress UspA family protein